MTVIFDIITQHAEDAAFLWFLLDAAVTPSPITTSTIWRNSTTASKPTYDGLRIAGDTG